MVSDDIKETDNGYEFDGILKAQTSQDISYDIVEGNISIKLDSDGNITDISGEGFPNFPDVENFQSILRDFDWKQKVRSHIEYKNGAYYKQTYNTNLPLTDDTFYFHFKIFDTENGGYYELKSNLNEKIYTFFDFYLDPNDPAVFFKLTFLPKKVLTKLSNNKTVKKLMAKILTKAVLLHQVW